MSKTALVVIDVQNDITKLYRDMLRFTPMAYKGGN